MLSGATCRWSDHIRVQVTRNRTRRGAARTRVKENHKLFAIVNVFQQLGTRVGVALCVSWRDGAGIRRLQWMEWKTNE